MKKSIWFFLFLVVCISCTEEVVECSDPTGSITINIPNNSYFCFKTGSIAGNCGFSIDLCCSDILFYPNNFSAASSVIGFDTSSPNIIVPIKGNSSLSSATTSSKLCDINEIPTSGYVTTMAANYDIGYVVKLADGTYARFVVKGFGTFTTGGVSSVQITYQYPFL
jgi:hypothetical protein